MTQKFNKQSVPLYVQIEEDIRNRILLEEWAEGDKLPTEEKFCEMYNVSRITVRKAITNLVDENLLYRKRGKGTFVNEWINPSITDSYTIVKSFTNEMKEIGKIATSLDVSVKVIPATNKLSHFLNVNLHEEVIELKRLRGYDDKIIAYFISYIPYKPFLSLNPFDYKDSFYDYLKEHNIVMNKENEYIESILPSASISRALGIDIFDPVLKRVRMCSDSRSNFFEYTECYYIGNSYRYYIENTDWRK